MKIGFAEKLIYQAKLDVWSRERISEQNWTVLAALLTPCWDVHEDSDR